MTRREVENLCFVVAAANRNRITFYGVRGQKNRFFWFGREGKFARVAEPVIISKTAREIVDSIAADIAEQIAKDPVWP